jgi:hypothetical protein
VGQLLPLNDVRIGDSFRRKQPSRYGGKAGALSEAKLTLKCLDKLHCDTQLLIRKLLSVIEQALLEFGPPASRAVSWPVLLKEIDDRRAERPRDAFDCRVQMDHQQLQKPSIEGGNHIFRRRVLFASDGSESNGQRGRQF